MVNYGMFTSNGNKKISTFVRKIKKSKKKVSLKKVHSFLKKMSKIKKYKEATDTFVVDKVFKSVKPKLINDKYLRKSIRR